MNKIILTALAGLVAVSACKKDEEATPTRQLSGTLSGSSQVPAVTTAATGTIMGTYAPSTKALAYTITYSGLSGAATGAHLHYGDAKHKTDAPTVPFTNFPSTASGTYSGTVTLTAMQADSLLANCLYANIHTAANGNG